MEKIEPTIKKEKYILEEKDYLLIRAIQELTRAIKFLNQKI